MSPALRFSLKVHVVDRSICVLRSTKAAGHLPPGAAPREVGQRGRGIGALHLGREPKTGGTASQKSIWGGDIRSSEGGDDFAAPGHHRRGLPRHPRTGEAEEEAAVCGQEQNQ